MQNKQNRLRVKGKETNCTTFLHNYVVHYLINLDVSSKQLNTVVQEMRDGDTVWLLLLPELKTA